MSLRNEIEKILCDFAEQAGNLVDTSKSSEATSQILSLLESLVPPEKPTKYMNVKNMNGELIDKAPMLSPEDRGYNAALQEIKEKMK